MRRGLQFDAAEDGLARGGDGGQDVEDAGVLEVSSVVHQDRVQLLLGWVSGCLL